MVLSYLCWKRNKIPSSFEYSTPDTVWGHYGLTKEGQKIVRMNPKMFNSFLCGDKSAIEMCAVTMLQILNVLLTD